MIIKSERIWREQLLSNAQVFPFCFAMKRKKIFFQENFMCKGKKKYALLKKQTKINKLREIDLFDDSTIVTMHRESIYLRKKINNNIYTKAKTQ